MFSQTLLLFNITMIITTIFVRNKIGVNAPIAHFIDIGSATICKSLLVDSIVMELLYHLNNMHFIIVLYVKVVLLHVMKKLT